MKSKKGEENGKQRKKQKIGHEEKWRKAQKEKRRGERGIGQLRPVYLSVCLSVCLSLIDWLIDSLVWLSSDISSQSVSSGPIWYTWNVYMKWQSSRALHALHIDIILILIILIIILILPSSSSSSSYRIMLCSSSLDGSLRVLCLKALLQMPGNKNVRRVKTTTRGAILMIDDWRWWWWHQKEQRKEKKGGRKEDIAKTDRRGRREGRVVAEKSQTTRRASWWWWSGEEKSRKEKDKRNETTRESKDTVTQKHQANQSHEKNCPARRKRNGGEKGDREVSEGRYSAEAHQTKTTRRSACLMMIIMMMVERRRKNGKRTEGENRERKRRRMGKERREHQVEARAIGVKKRKEQAERGEENEKDRPKRKIRRAGAEKPDAIPSSTVSLHSCSFFCLLFSSPLRMCDACIIKVRLPAPSPMRRRAPRHQFESDGTAPNDQKIETETRRKAHQDRGNEKQGRGEHSRGEKDGNSWKHKSNSWLSLLDFVSC